MTIDTQATRADAESASMAASDQANTEDKTMESFLFPQVQRSYQLYQESISEGGWVVPASMIASTSKTSPEESVLKIKTPSQKLRKKLNGNSVHGSKIDKGKQPMRYDSILPQDIMDRNSGVVHVEPMTSTPTRESTAKGNKRMREDEGMQVIKPSKRVKKSLGSAVTRANKSTTGSAKKSRAKCNVNSICETNWKLLKEPVQHNPQKNSNTTGVSPLKETDFRPRIWTNNREELLAMMPEMTGPGCVNGVSWKLYETPLILLDEFNPCFHIVRKEQDSLSLDLVTTRDFVRPMPTEAEIETSKMIVNGQPPSPFTEPTNIEGKLTEEKTIRRRRAPRYKSIEPDKSTRMNAGTTSSIASNEIPTITFEIDPAKFVQSRSGVDASSIPTTIKLEPPPGTKTSMQDGVNAVAARLDIVSPATDIISDFFDDAFKTLNLEKPPAPSFDATGIIEKANSPFLLYVYSNDTNDGDMCQQLDTDNIHPAPIATYNYLEHLSMPAYLHANENSQMEALYCPGPSFHPGFGSLLGHNHDMYVWPSNNSENTPQSMPAYVSNGSPTEKHKDQSESYDIVDSEEIYGVPPCVSSADKLLGDAHVNSGLHMINADQDLDNMLLVDSTDGMAIKSELISSSIVSNITQNVLEYIPSSIPEELQAMVDSYLFGRPLTLMASNAYIQAHWLSKLPDEYGYVMMGYFKILGIQEIRIPMERDVDMNTSNVAISGRVQWKFHLKWYPGGEKFLFPKHPYLEYPWWRPPSPALEEDTDHFMGDAQILESKEDDIQSFSDDDNIEESFETTPRYRDARKRHHEYKFRNRPLDDLYYSLLPLHLLVPFGPKYLDSALPKGWLCKDCGRMNFQEALRHRSCSSTFCKDKPPPVAPYALDLFLLRDPQEQMPLSTPLNVYPLWLTNVKVDQFDNGMQTFSYSLEENPNIFMKHIFTSNALPLQEDASSLLSNIQINVPLKRSLVDNNPYFTWLGKRPKGITTLMDIAWPNIPPTMNEAKNFLVSRILAWITAGTKKSTDHIHAKTKSVIFCALGCTVVLLIYPGSLKGINAPGDEIQESVRSRAPEVMPEDEQADAQEEVPSGWITDLQADGDEVTQEVTASPKKTKSVPKAERPIFTFVLMHGDILVLHGDEFEYSVKRDGTSLLLIASHDSTEHG